MIMNEETRREKRRQRTKSALSQNTTSRKHQPDLSKHPLEAASAGADPQHQRF